MKMYDHNGVILLHGDSADLLPRIPPADLIVTSPPYDGIRTFGDNDGYDFYQIGMAIADSLAEGGVMCWHTNDQVVDGGYTGTSLRQALWFMDKGGLRLHDRIIVDITRISALAANRWINTWDFVWVFSKGKPKTFNAIKDRPNVTAGKVCDKNTGSAGRRADGSTKYINFKEGYTIPPFGKRTGIWYMPSNIAERSALRLHPSPMPMRLVKDLIRAYSNEGDLVVDPFGGGMTTPYAAQLLRRNGIGIEIHKPYIETAIAKRFCNQPMM